MQDTVVFSFKTLGGFTDEEFYYFCLDNPDHTFERNAKGQIIFMPNTGGLTGDKNSEINMQLRLWNKQAQTGKVFDSSTSFRLPDTAVKSPDASWVSIDRWNQLTDKEKRQFPPLCPDFVIELRSETDSLSDLILKTQEWMDNGCQLAWLIDPKTQTTQIFRPNQVPELTEGFDKALSGEGILQGFTLGLRELV
jgi:Uma2 family endonuclease